MVVRHNVTSFEDFNSLISELEGKNIFVLFCGSRTEGGASWCPDCVRAEPVVEKVLSGKKDAEDADFHFIDVEVGDRTTWRNPNNPFRKDERIALTCVPTLLRWGGEERLGDKECSDASLVEMAFSSS